MKSKLNHIVVLKSLLIGALLIPAGCATVSNEPAEPDNAPRKEIFYAVTASNQLISFNAGQPQKILSKKPLSGLQAGEEIVGIDYRVAKGVLFALGRSAGDGRLYTIDTGSGKATQVGSGVLAVKPEGDEFGFDFNPTVDRIRVVSNTGQNMRLHPDTGAVVDSNANEPGIQTDGKLVYAAGDVNAGKSPAVVAAGYTYNKVNKKITTNYAIDAATESLVTQGTKEGTTPAVSPNTGQLFTVGKLGTGAFARETIIFKEGQAGTFMYMVKTGRVAIACVARRASQ